MLAATSSKPLTQPLRRRARRRDPARGRRRRATSSRRTSRCSSARSRAPARSPSTASTTRAARGRRGRRAPTRRPARCTACRARSRSRSRSAGMPNAAGLVARREHRAAEDAPSVARLRAAGAIPLGVTNTSEMTMWIESHNHLYGRTSSAYDPQPHRGRLVRAARAPRSAAAASPFGLGCGHRRLDPAARVLQRRLRPHAVVRRRPEHRPVPGRRRRGGADAHARARSRGGPRT